MPPIEMPTVRGDVTVTTPPTLTMQVTPEMLTILQQLTLDSGQPLDVVFTQAIGLYREALRVTSEGKHVGYSASPDALEVEFTGFSNNEAR